MAIGIALVGAGIFAKEEHLPAVQAADAFELKAIYSRSLKTAKGLAEGQGNVELYSEDAGDGKAYKDLLNRSDVQAIIVALPILAQPEYIKAALTAGKHVLSEKPIAGDIKAARELLDWYQSSVDISKVFWSVAENFRYLASFERARSLVAGLGRILTFRVRMQAFVDGGKYFETAWRKVPEYQGGFLLDAGVHFTGGIRLLLGSDQIARLSAMTAQLQKHLPPRDTIEACAKTKSGAVGTISISFGTTAKGSEWQVGCEGGSISVSDGVITKVVNGEEEEKITVEDERTGVPPEVRAFGEALKKGKPDPLQSPEQALGDLELIELMLRSGEEDGTPQNCEFQAA